ncbi:DUF1972 domain-containing protein [Microbacterium testaceum]|uniref:DUF1972 domain-containing protein n=1 Tax=Microbacterium testaceum TaxID=2033 RepID=UPI0021CB213B|nr:DUF1972 domain-containing protein [Microbacterium testaceum]
MAIIGTRGYPSYYGGFETAVRRLAPYLADQGWDVTVYGRRGAVSIADLDADPRVHSVETFGLERKSLSTLSYGLSAALHAQKIKPDVALVMNVANGYYLPILKRAGIKTVVNVDGIEWERAKWGRVARTIFQTGAKLTAKYADSLVYDSLEIGKYWRGHFAREGHFIPYGGEPHEPLPFGEAFPPGSYVLAVARFVPENSIPEFIEAAREISRSHNVVIVGSSGYGGELDEKVSELANANQSVFALGHISDDVRLHSLWQHAGLYFHGHSVGGTNPTLVQAMALGAATLARDTVYNREVLAEAGTFTSPNPSSIASNAIALMNDPDLRALLGERSQKRARDSYSWNAVCRRYDEVLCDQLKRNA